MHHCRRHHVRIVSHLSRPAGGDSKDRSGAARTWRGAREVTSAPGGRELCESTSNERSNAARPRRRTGVTGWHSATIHPCCDILICSRYAWSENTSETNIAQVTGPAAGKCDDWRAAANSSAEENTFHWRCDGRRQHGCSNRGGHGRWRGATFGLEDRDFSDHVGSTSATERAWCTCNTCRTTECTKSLTCRWGSSRCRCAG